MHMHILVSTKRQNSHNLTQHKSKFHSVHLFVFSPSFKYIYKIYLCIPVFIGLNVCRIQSFDDLLPNNIWNDFSVESFQKVRTTLKKLIYYFKAGMS